MSLEEMKTLVDDALSTIQPERFWYDVRNLIAVAEAAREFCAADDTYRDSSDTHTEDDYWAMVCAAKDKLAKTIKALEVA